MILLILGGGVVLFLLVKRGARKARIKATSAGMSGALDVAEAMAARDVWAPRSHRKYGMWP